jgi:hypothetical protein
LVGRVRVGTDGASIYRTETVVRLVQTAAAGLDKENAQSNVPVDATLAPAATPAVTAVRSVHGCCVLTDGQVHLLDPSARVHVATATLGAWGSAWTGRCTCRD